MARRTSIFAAFIIVTAAGAIAVALSHAQKVADQGIDNGVRRSMRQKLEHAKTALEGLALEDFKLIEAAADRMSLLTEADFWHVYHTPEYAKLSIDFQKAVEALKRAAQQKNVDAATLRYMKVTISCVECHKHVRNVRVVAVPGPDDTLFAVLNAKPTITDH